MEKLQDLLRPRSRAAVDNQNGVEFEDLVRLRLVKAGPVTSLLQRASVLPHVQLTFDEQAQRTRRSLVAPARTLRSFLLACAGAKKSDELGAAGGEVLLSHREALMVFFAQRAKDKVVEVDAILE